MIFIFSSNCWSRSSGLRGGGGRRGGKVAGSGGGEVLLDVASHVDHFGSLEEDISVLYYLFEDKTFDTLVHFACVGKKNSWDEDETGLLSYRFILLGFLFESC